MSKFVNLFTGELDVIKLKRENQMLSLLMAWALYLRLQDESRNLRSHSFTQSYRYESFGLLVFARFHGIDMVLNASYNNNSNDRSSKSGSSEASANHTCIQNHFD
jgi:hypothetical protein